MREPEVIDAKFTVIDAPKAVDTRSRQERREAMAEKISEWIAAILVMIGSRYLFMYLMHHPHWLR